MVTKTLKLTIDDELVHVVEVRTVRDGYRLMVRPLNSNVSGPHSQHDVPQLEGTFRTNGHLYKFGVEDAVQP